MITIKWLEITRELNENHFKLDEMFEQAYQLEEGPEQCQ